MEETNQVANLVTSIENANPSKWLDTLESVALAPVLTQMKDYVLYLKHNLNAPWPSGR